MTVRKTQMRAASVGSLLCLTLVAQLAVTGGAQMGGYDDPLALLKTLASLPPAQQEILLLVVGSTLQAKTGMNCNIFAGAAACQRLPTDSSYMQQCPGVDPKVDCIFAEQVNKNIYDSPVDDLYNYLEVNEHLDIKDACPQCFANVQAMWCALAAPKCGSYKTYVQLGMLPILTTTINAYSEAAADGLSFDDAAHVAHALSGAVEAVLEAMALTLPCREMCVAVVETCDCDGTGGSETVGSLMDWVEKSQTSPNTDVADQINKALFKKVWDRPFCDLFLPSTTKTPAPFAGKCVAMAPACQDRAKWCDAAGPAKANALRHIQAALLKQLTQAVTGWLSDAKSGLLPTSDALKAGGSDLDALKQKFVDQHTGLPVADAEAPAPRRGTPVGLIVLSCLGGMTIVLAVAGTVLYNWVRLRRAERGYVELQQADHFGVLEELSP